MTAALCFVGTEHRICRTGNPSVYDDRLKRLKAAPRPPNEEDNEARKSALQIGNHAVWTGVAFVIIILVAVGLEGFEHLLLWLKLIEKDSPLDWAIRVVACALAVLDFALLLGVVGKLALRFLKSI